MLTLWQAFGLGAGCLVAGLCAWELALDDPRPSFRRGFFRGMAWAELVFGAMMLGFFQAWAVLTLWLYLVELSTRVPQ